MRSRGQILRKAKQSTLTFLRAAGAMDAAARSAWRRERLLILCYHGISTDDEHRWSPGLYLSADGFERRLRFLRENDYRVLPLAEAVRLQRAGELPPRSVCLTFDDGFRDFHVRAAPALAAFGYPATVYLTTYYSEYNVPIFGLMCSYLLWQARDRTYRGLAGGPHGGPVDLSSAPARNALTRRFQEFADEGGISGREKNELLVKLAGSLRLPYEKWLERRTLHLMSGDEAAQAAAAGFDIQLHTHTHDTPAVKERFLREVEENRRRIEGLTGRPAVHFCYPSGYVRPEFPEWLREAGVETATTCEAGLAGRRTDPLLLPRLLDGERVSMQDFEAWVCGLGALLPRRRGAAAASGRRGGGGM